MVNERMRSFKELPPIVMRQLDNEKIDNCIDHVMDIFENYT